MGVPDVLEMIKDVGTSDLEGDLMAGSSTLGVPTQMAVIDEDTYSNPSRPDSLCGTGLAVYDLAVG